MSFYDISQDAPGLLRTESLSMKLSLQRLSPTTARIIWNIPTPAGGCSADDQAYCGILLTLGNSRSTADDVPIDGQVYNSDPTADPNLFTGDKISTKLVIGAFYQDRETNFLDVTGLNPSTPYYVSGYPVDCQFRYFKPGIHAYSMDASYEGKDGTSGRQVLQVNPPDGPGIDPSDYTGLSTSRRYDFNLKVGLDPYRPIGVAHNKFDCSIQPKTYKIKIDGTRVNTYQDLVDEMNRQFALLHESFKGPLPPNTGMIYWDEEQQKLYKWDGYKLVELPIIVSSVDPTVISDGMYWYSPETKILSQWDEVNVQWNDVQYITMDDNPLEPIFGQLWFNSTNNQIYRWNGNTWCETNVIISNTDPSSEQNIPEGAYWFNTELEILYFWNSTLEVWIDTVAVQSPVDPTNLPDGYFWYNTDSNLLYIRDTDEWVLQSNVTISPTAPTLSIVGHYWINSVTLDLFEGQGGTNNWTEITDYIVFYQDPTDIESCDLWWDLTNDRLNQWNVITNNWITVDTFYQQSEDPREPINLPDGTIWYNPDTGEIHEWYNQCMTLVDYWTLPTDPTSLADDTIRKTSDDKFFVKSGTSWIEFFPTISLTDPSVLPINTFWYDATNDAVLMWNGTSWVSISYTTTSPVPLDDTLWFNTKTNQMLQWDGQNWILFTPRIIAGIDCNGNIVITDTTVGSNSFVSVEKDSSGSYGTLFGSLAHGIKVINAIPGSDDVPDQPSYLEEGVGTDGSDAIRKQLGNEIRYELGYPTVGVELTDQQIDLCITKALETIRQRTSAAYKRSFYMMQITSNTQKYLLTDKTIGFNKIVEVLGVYRLTSAFLSSAHGAGVYGQIVLQQLYNMGTYDLTSHFLMSNYVSMMEQLFASRVTFTWNEHSRELWLHNRFPFNERATLLDTVVERTEQELLVDRYLRPLMRKLAAGFARIMLSEIRGKFSTLPSASGGTSLNASDLRQQGDKDIESGIADIENYVADRPEEFGRYDFTWG